LTVEAVKAVIFDLDHTLVVSGIDFAEMKSSIVSYLKERIPCSDQLDATKPTYEIAESASQILWSHGLSEAIPKVLNEINRIMTETEMKYVSKARLIEGAPETLKRLKSAGVKIGILTRSCRKYTDEILLKTGLSEFVDYVEARDDCANPKPDPTQMHLLMQKMKVKPDETIMVGDHPVDSLCARNSGVRFVGVLTGSWDAERTAQLGQTVIPSVKDLPRLLGI
jgi:phosphoglycolate phosphatase